MTDAAAAKPAATAGHSKNSAAPEPEVTAAAAPCGCAERIDSLDGRLTALELMSRAVGWMSVAVAFAVVYLLWTGPLKDDQASK